MWENLNIIAKYNNIIIVKCLPFFYNIIMKGLPFIHLFYDYFLLYCLLVIIYLIKEALLGRFIVLYCVPFNRGVIVVENLWELWDS